jgi:hypothetical protein
MNWVLLIGAVWLLVAVLVGVLIGRAVRLADRKEAGTAAARGVEPNFVVDEAAPGTDAAPGAGAPGPVRHPIPSARPPAGDSSTPSSGRTSSTRESGLY